MATTAAAAGSSSPLATPAATKTLPPLLRVYAACCATTAAGIIAFVVAVAAVVAVVLTVPGGIGGVDCTIELHFDRAPFRVIEESSAAAAAGNKEKEQSKPKPCKAMSPCLTDQDCGDSAAAGHKKSNIYTPKPRCQGALVNRCDCSACSIGKVCSNDTACGGLRTACSKGFCNCLQAAQTLYDESDPAVRPKTLGLGLVEACNKVVCNSAPDACFGLPCRKGYCLCT